MSKIPTKLTIAPRGHARGYVNPQQEINEPEIWLVLDERGHPVYCASYSAACHEHINDAINDYDIEGAALWKVRQARLAPNETSA